MEKLLDRSVGSPSALNEVVPFVYEQLRRVAQSRLRKRCRDCMLDPTELVHEAYLHLSRMRSVVCENRPQFLALAGTIMSGILVDHLRARRARKRGGGLTAVVLTELASCADVSVKADLIDLDRVLCELELIGPQKACILKMRFFECRSVKEIAQCMGISPSTVKRDLVASQTWIRDRLL